MGSESASESSREMGLAAAAALMSAAGLAPRGAFFRAVALVGAGVLALRMGKPGGRGRCAPAALALVVALTACLSAKKAAPCPPAGPPDSVSCASLVDSQVHQVCARVLQVGAQGGELVRDWHV
jgi:hypothetical protein